MTKSNLSAFFAGVVVTALAGVSLLSTTGFQTTSMKVGTVDAARAGNDSETAKTANEDLQKQLRNRAGILEFIQTYPTMTDAAATRFRELSLKPTPTDADRAEIDKIKNATIAEEKKSRDLQTKASPTQDDLKAIEAYRALSVGKRELLDKWSREFDTQLRTSEANSIRGLRDRVRNAIAEVGKKEGYTVIHDSQAAPYAANDVTEAVLKIVNRR